MDIEAAIKSMPKEEWFRARDLTGGVHNPDVWRALCTMKDRSQHYEEYVLVSTPGRVHFMWKRADNEW